MGGSTNVDEDIVYSLWRHKVFWIKATTLSAQSVISTAENLFEGFIADNYYFLDINECLEWCQTVLSDLDGCDVDDFIKAHSLIDVRDRLYDHLIQRDEDDKDILYDYLSDIPEELLSVIYYKNNLMEFIKDHEEITDLLLTIFESVKNLNYIDEDDDEWQLKVDSDLENEFYEVFKGKSAKDYNKFVDKQYFLDPNDPPVTVIHYLELLKDYVMKYVYVRYLAFDRIYRLKNFKRSTVTVIDTDSNILSLDTIVNYIFDEIIKSEKFGRSTRNNEFILVNTICYLLTGVVTDILLTYGEYSNIPEEFRPIFSMKNEFFFEILIIGEKKKRYISKIVLREGNLLKKPKSDVKGLNRRPHTKRFVLENRVKCWKPLRA